MARLGIDLKIVNTLGVNIAPKLYIMDDVNSAHTMPADVSGDRSQTEPTTGQLQTLTEAGDGMKTEMATQAQQIEQAKQALKEAKWFEQ